MKTISEIEELKLQWEADPCWDIESTEGFEDHEEELKSHRKRKEIEWHQQAMQEEKDKADELGCPDNLKLARYVMSLERRIDKLEGESE